MKIIRMAVAGSLESSDLLVTVEPGSNGIELTLESTVIDAFGEAIRETVLRTLERCGVTDCKIAVDDRGALDYAIAARVEAAVSRAGGSEQ